MGLTDDAATRTRTACGPSEGSGSSTTVRASGPPRLLDDDRSHVGTVGTRQRLRTDRTIVCGGYLEETA